MNYRRIYNELIMKAWRRGGVEGYKEKHHIIPRCQGGGNDKANLVELTAAEHYIAHLLLTKMFPGSHNLAFPLFMMGKSLGKSLNNKLFEKARKRMSENRKGKPGAKHSDESRAKISAGNLGKKMSEESKTKMSKAKKGKKLIGPREKMSEETRAKMSKAKKGGKLTAEHKAKIGESSKGRKLPLQFLAQINRGKKCMKLSDDTKAKISAAHKGKKRTPESIAKQLATRTKNKEREEILQFWCAL